MRSFHTLVCFLCLTAPLSGCNLFGSILGGNQLTVDYTFIANGESRAVPLNADGETVGTTGNGPIKVAFADHQFTFGDPGTVKATDAFSVPIVTLDDGTKWIHRPLDVTVGGSSARTPADTADIGLDSAAPPDTSAPAVDNGAIIGTAIGSFLAEGTWTCMNLNLRTELATTEVTYPDSSTVVIPFFGAMMIVDMDLTRPDNGTNVVYGTFVTNTITNRTTIGININPTDGSDTEVGMFHCWAGFPEDIPE